MKSLEDFNEGVLNSANFKISKAGYKIRAHRIRIGDKTGERLEYTKGKKDKLKEAAADNMAFPDPPIILVIRRKAVRLYPDGTRIALYYSEKLKRHFSVPYGPAFNSVIQAENFIEQLKVIQEEKEEQTVELSDGALVEFDTSMIEHILYAYSKLTEQNKEKFVESLTNTEESFNKTYEFCRTHFKF
jgi:hypothetical protein